MNIASTYLFCVFIILVLAIVGPLIITCCRVKKSQGQIEAYLTFLYCFFAFGIVFAGCGCIQGAILNPLE